MAEDLFLPYDVSESKVKGEYGNVIRPELILTVFRPED